jgi:hypothetical protein
MSIGEIGEDFFCSLATRLGMTVNSSKRDKYGWDTIIEFDNKKEMPLDKSPSHYQCFVQVKTTKNNTQSVPIKLSNWDRMIKNSNPYFVFFIQLDEKHKPKRIYLSHIGEKWIKKVLQRLRKNEQSMLLHKQKLSYSPDDSEIVEDLENLKKIFIEYIGESNADYAVNKKKLVETIGYKEYRIALNFSINANMEDIVDFSIGAKKELPVEKLKIFDDIRFEIPGKITEIENCLISYNPNNNCKVRLSLDNDYSVFLDGRIRLPNLLLNNLPNNLSKIGIETDIISFIIYNNQISISLNIRFLTAVQNIKTLSKLAKVVLILSNGKKDYRLEVFDNADEVVLIMKIPHYDRNNIIFNQNSLRIATFIDDLDFIFRYFDLDREEEIDFNNLSVLNELIRNIRIFIDMQFNDKITLEFDLVDGKIIKNTGVAFPVVFFLKINKKILQISGVYIGHISRINNKYNAKVRVRLGDKAILNTNNFNLVDARKKVMDELIEKYKDKYKIILLNE